MEIFATSEYNVTYYIGAGASAQALPTVNQTPSTEGLSQSFISMADELKTNSAIDSIYHDFRDYLSSSLLWLAESSDKFGTVDTFAKFLYLKRSPQLDRLKITLSTFFTIKQFIDKKTDERALIFLTTVMQLGEIFPSNIKIISWNYDFQIQLAAEVFRKEEFVMNRDGATIYAPALVPYYPTLGRHPRSVSELSMVQLNGIAGFYYYDQVGMNLNYFLNEHPKDINNLFEKLNTDSQRKHHLLTFAWEVDTTASDQLKHRINYAKALVKESDILVIVGYSFPFFNREIDKEIFSSIKEGARLKKIFYQDPFRSGDFLMNQFDLDKNIEIKHVSNTKNYFVPVEL
jgi:hypothetical protein